MSVTHAEIDKLSDRETQLESQIREARGQIERARSQAVAENRALLEQLRKDTAIALEQRDRAIKEKYSDILSRNMTEQEQYLQNELKRLQDEYDEVCAQIREETAVRHKEAEQLLTVTLLVLLFVTLLLSRRLLSLLSPARQIKSRLFFPCASSLEQPYSIRLTRTSLVSSICGWDWFFLQDSLHI